MAAAAAAAVAAGDVVAAGAAGAAAAAVVVVVGGKGPSAAAEEAVVEGHLAGWGWPRWEGHQRRGWGHPRRGEGCGTSSSLRDSVLSGQEEMMKEERERMRAREMEGGKEGGGEG